MRMRNAGSVPEARVRGGGGGGLGIQFVVALTATLLQAVHRCSSCQEPEANVVVVVVQA